MSGRRRRRRRGGSASAGACADVGVTACGRVCKRIGIAVQAQRNCVLLMFASVDTLEITIPNAVAAIWGNGVHVCRTGTFFGAVGGAPVSARLRYPLYSTVLTHSPVFRRAVTVEYTA
jgi:hypothetical protein